MMPGLNPTCRKSGRGASVDVGAGVGQFGPKVRFNLEEAISEGMKEQLEEEVAPLLVGRVVQKVEKLRLAMRAVELLASLVPGDVAESLRDGLGGESTGGTGPDGERERAVTEVHRAC